MDGPDYKPCDRFDIGGTTALSLGRFKRHVSAEECGGTSERLRQWIADANLARGLGRPRLALWGAESRARRSGGLPGVLRRATNRLHRLLRDLVAGGRPVS